MIMVSPSGRVQPSVEFDFGHPEQMLDDRLAELFSNAVEIDLGTHQRKVSIDGLQLSFWISIESISWSKIKLIVLTFVEINQQKHL